MKITELEKCVYSPANGTSFHFKTEDNQEVEINLKETSIESLELMERLLAQTLHAKYNERAGMMNRCMQEPMRAPIPEVAADKVI